MDSSSIVDFYEVLGVPVDASFDAIKIAFRAKATKLHPDKNPDRDTTAAFQKLLCAWETLKDPVRRRDYDKLWELRFGSSKRKSSTNAKPGKPSTDTDDASGKPSGRNAQQSKNERRKSSTAEARENTDEARNVTRERLVKALEELTARERVIERELLHAAADLREETRRRDDIKASEPVMPDGPWYTMKRPKKKQREAHLRNIQDWSSQTDAAEAAVRRAKNKLSLVEDEMQLTRQQMANVVTELKVEAIIDGATALAATVYPWVASASEAMYRTAAANPTSTLVAMGLAAAASAVTWKFAAGR